MDEQSWLRRSWSSSESASQPAETLVIAFAGLAGRLGGAGGHRAGDRHVEQGHAGLPPHEFVKACQRAGATHAIFCRDLQQAWYLRGTPDKPKGGFDAVIAALRAETAELQPKRIVTIGASMGGYAAIRAGLALGAQAVVAFSPQVLVDSTQRSSASLPPMPFDDGLRTLKRTLWMEGQPMTSLVDVVAQVSKEREDEAEQVGGDGKSSTAIELHVGSNERGDVLEAELLARAVNAATAERPPGEQAASAALGEQTVAGGAQPQSRGKPPPVSLTLVEHKGRDHNLVTALRDEGLLDELLARHINGRHISASSSTAMAASPQQPISQQV